LIVSVFEWHKTVLEVSFRAVKLSNEAPKWIWWHTRTQQVVCGLALPILYGFGGSFRANPRCGIFEALTIAYLYIISWCVGASLTFSLFVVSKQVAGVTREDQSTGRDPNAKRATKYRQVLKKIRRITMFVILNCLAVSYNIFSKVADQGEPNVSCNGVFADVIGPLTGTLSSFLILWSTSIARTHDGTVRPVATEHRRRSGGTESKLSADTYQSRFDSSTKMSGDADAGGQRGGSMTGKTALQSVHVGQHTIRGGRGSGDSGDDGRRNATRVVHVVPQMPPVES